MIEPTSIPIKDHALSQFTPGEDVLYMYDGINGYWALCRVLRLGKKMVRIEFIRPDSLELMWVYPWALRKVTDIPFEWHEAWLSAHEDDIKTRLRRRAYRRVRRTIK